MAGAGLNITYTPELKNLQNIQKKLASPLQIMQKIARVVERDQRNHIIKDEVVPKTPKPSGKTLYDTGRLVRSIKGVAIDSHTILCGTNVIYAAIHQFGGIIRPKHSEYLCFPIIRRMKRGKTKNWVKVKEVKMPKRPFLYFKDAERKNIILTVGVYLGGQS